jgi:CRISPR-associated endonuclease/helicase Cas3
MLRLLSSDLVLDEIDDFDLNDLPALSRLVNWAGMLGTKVLLSSATLPPALVQGLFEAYRAGRVEFQRNRGEPNQPLAICCAWFDEHNQHHQECPDTAAFQLAHDAFAGKRHQRLAQDEVRRRGELLHLTKQSGSCEELRASLADDLLTAAQRLHECHKTKDPHSDKSVSFGLIRMANIDPLVDVARNLFRQGPPAGVRIHLCVYHSQYPLLMRSAIEHRLDEALNRQNPEEVFNLADIRQRLDAYPEPDHLFIVLGSPVSEVGRDHDYDWAIVEPSSMRSLIQLVGRVRRHRFEPSEVPNIMILNTNLRALEKRDEPAFCRPGFEGEGEWRLSSHKLDKLLNAQEWEIIDARPRIVPREPLRPQHNLVDLEHARLKALMIEPVAKPISAKKQKLKQMTVAPPPLGAYSWYVAPQSTLTGLLQKWRPFREDNRDKKDLVLLPNEDEDDFILHGVTDDRQQRTNVYVSVGNLLERSELDISQGIAPWGETDYMEALERLAEVKELSLRQCAEIFGGLSLDDRADGWCFHPALGFTQRK